MLALAWLVPFATHLRLPMGARENLQRGQGLGEPRRELRTGQSEQRRRTDFIPRGLARLLRRHPSTPRVTPMDTTSGLSRATAP